MRIVHDGMARVWVTPKQGDSTVRWRTRLVVGREDGRTFAAIVDPAGVGETVEVRSISGRWLETVGGAEWAWAPSHGHPTALASAFALRPLDDLADVIELDTSDDLAGELASFTVPELRKLAAAAGHEGISTLRKAELVSLLSSGDDG